MASKIPCNEWPVLTEAEVSDKLTTLPKWKLVRSPQGIPRLVTEFSTVDFVEAVKYVQAAAVVAEKQGHHPDLHITGTLNTLIRQLIHFSSFN